MCCTMDMDKIYDYAKSEQEARTLWQQEQIYAFQEQSTQPTFSIDTPPPTVSGTLHIGHIFSYTHADLIARYKRMQGYNVFYPMGYDDNGLPTERFVEKKNNTKAHLMKRGDFIALCLKETHDVEKLFENLWQRMGLSIDWKRTYSTISHEVRKLSQQSFIELQQKGFAYRKNEPALYCTSCRTSVAQAELDSNEVTTTFNDITFTTHDGNAVVIATTRPELLPACVAVFYHPTDERYQHLNGTMITTPIFNNQVPVLPDEKVNPEKGSGLVMCCTFGDQNDIYWYKMHKLPYLHIVGFDGIWTDQAGPLAGLKVHEARKKVLELLSQEGKLVNQKPLLHAVNIHERCKQEIEYLVLSQWFIDILKHKDDFLDAADKIEWRPAHMKMRYRDWVQNLHWDWGISRQRFFGIPFPVWYCQDCNQALIADIKDLPIDPQEQSFPGGACTACHSKNIVPEADVMDTWNTSALTPQISSQILSKGNIPLPMDVRPQAHDIIRTWAFDTIVKAHYHHNTIPWKTIMMSGHVLAGKEKISKSKGNEKITPDALLATFPADVIRFWAANGKLGTDTAFSENQLKIGHKLVTKLWNAFRFLQEHLSGFTPTNKPTTLLHLNEWALHELNLAIIRYKKQFEEYEYSHALEAVDGYFWQIFCDNYLELVKDQFFNPDKYTEQERYATKHTLYEIGFALLQMYAPFLPHVTESIYQLMFKQTEQTTSLHKTIFHEERWRYSFPDSVQVVAQILAIVNQVRKLKSEHHLSLKTELKNLTVSMADTALKQHLEHHSILIAGICKALTISFVPQATEETSLTQEGELITVIVRI